VAAVLAAATILATGLVIFPDSKEEEQANPCAENIITQEPSTGDSEEIDSDVECESYGPVGIEE
jgi:hypothetical protein